MDKSLEKDNIKTDSQGEIESLNGPKPLKKLNQSIVKSF